MHELDPNLILFQMMTIIFLLLNCDDVLTITWFVEIVKMLKFVREVKSY